jgi:hypothetical protein
MKSERHVLLPSLSWRGDTVAAIFRLLGAALLDALKDRLLEDNRDVDSFEVDHGPLVRVLKVA